MNGQGGITINGRAIGAGHPVYIIAEMSANHGQDYDRAVRILEAAKAAGADAIKLQTYTPDTLTIDCDAEPFRIKGTIWEGRTLYELYGEACTPWDWQPRLLQAARGLGLDLFSSPFDESAVDFLEQMDVPAYKIASFELGHLPLLRKVAATGRPVILSTGMATLEEIGEAVDTLRAAGAGEMALLKCTSAYPARHADMHLRTIPDMARRFGLPVGLSDHSEGIAAAVAAVALGACIVEKHLTLSRADGGPDSAFSLEPGEFAAMTQAVRQAEEALGEVRYALTEQEKQSRVFRRSLFAVADIAAGEQLTGRNVAVIRPGHGLHPRHLPQVLGSTAACAIKRGTPLCRELIVSRGEGS